MFLRVDPERIQRQLDDVTCMSPIFDRMKQDAALSQQTNWTSLKVAVYSHKSHKIKGPIRCSLGMKDEKLCGLIGCLWKESDDRIVPSCQFDARYMDNGGKQSFKDIVRFLAKSHVVFTSSFHGMVWGTLLGKRVIIHGDTAVWFKMQSFPYPPTLYTGDLYADMGRAHVYPLALARCRGQNRQFYLEMLRLIERTTTPDHHNETLLPLPSITRHFKYPLCAKQTSCHTDYSKPKPKSYPSIERSSNGWNAIEAFVNHSMSYN